MRLAGGQLGELYAWTQWRWPAALVLRLHDDFVQRRSADVM